MKVLVPLLRDSIACLKNQLHTALQAYFTDEEIHTQPGKYSAWVSLPLKVELHSSQQKDYLSLEAVYSLSFTPQEVQVLYIYAHKHKQTIQIAILSFIKQILQEQKKMQILLRDKKNRRLEVTLWKEMELRESEG